MPVDALKADGTGGYTNIHRKSSKLNLQMKFAKQNQMLYFCEVTIVYICELKRE